MSLQDLLAAENNLTTHMGKAFLSERVVLRGLDLHHDLANQHSWFSVHLYAITGRIFAPNELALLDYLWSSTGYPDASIWPNNTAALAGSVRSTASLSMAAALVTSEATLFGGRPLKRSVDFFLRAKKQLAQGKTIPELIEEETAANGIIFGYGRPLASIDERIPHTLKKAQELGLADGECVKIALLINDYLVEHKKIAFNIVAIDGALGADLGFTPEQFHLYMNLCFYAGQPPCYLDALQRPQGSFFSIRCESVVYNGRAKRVWQNS
jgi:hypothetical protein